jgi:hypothetical protein
MMMLKVIDFELNGVEETCKESKVVKGESRKERLRLDKRLSATMLEQCFLWQLLYKLKAPDKLMNTCASIVTRKIDLSVRL